MSWSIALISTTVSRAVLVKVYCIDRDEFVGYEGGGLLLKPDAGSNAFQVLCYNSEDDYANEDQLILQRLFEMNDRVICEVFYSVNR